MLKILIAPSAFKGTLSPIKVAQAIESGVNNSGVDCQLELAPIGDGGDGTLECLHFALGGSFEQVNCHGPTGVVHTASWLQLPECAVVELASCCGLGWLAADQLQPMTANTLGLGEVIAHVQKLSDNIVVTLGGSASTDGGSGALKALGARFLDRNGTELALGGGALSQLATIDLLSVEQISSLKIAVDVTNPLLGVNGAARVFAPQKGASEEEVGKLESGLERYADLLEATTNKRARDIPGSGAAGGTAFGLMLGLNAELVSGFHWLAELLHLDEKIRWADLVITAEGRLDEQSLKGKATGELAKLCLMHGTRLIVVAARVDKACDLKAAEITSAREISSQGVHVSAADISSAVSQLVIRYVG